MLNNYEILQIYDIINTKKHYIIILYLDIIKKTNHRKN